jgi:hypothetical protein
LNTTASQGKNQILFLFYFFLSTFFTWLFVAASPLYISQKQMLLSTAIAGGKWGIQLVLGFIFLGNKKWEFVKNIGLVCFIGSCVLLPYFIFAKIGIASGASFFIGSLFVSVAVMIFFYYRAIRKTEVKLKWWIFWLVCLAIAISLQLTVVFHVI